MIVVTGATGGVGGDVVRQLTAAGRPVRALSRHPESLDVPDGVEVRGADLADGDSLAAAFAGGTALFLYATFGDPDLPVAAARAAGIERIVLLSSAAVRDGAGDRIARHHRAVEQAVEASGLAWTHLRPGGFASNARWFAPQVRDGVVRLAHPQVGTVPIDPADIAAVAAHALTEDGHAGRAHRLTGPEWLTQADEVRIIGAALGVPLRVEQVDPETEIAVLARSIPERFARGRLEIQAAMVGQPSYVVDTVERIVGRPARTFADWVADHVDDFR
ncbi:NmrA family transcriptional regulator [Actinocatenispora thailandica]|uniref:NmrA family transcriptional regulator n=1 Tax=Actinocatenispora thailandica TaxID=227318 RepID=A0A7R7DS16_9ACTN|nr:NAD(P)H-binding protein [Actinocatenispora thailandica]BCJ36820.1 NmrA family transcriptional regulator [Actinocatenispora thailandica]